MKITPTKQEFDHLHNANVQLSCICTMGRKCETCFLSEYFAYADGCPVSELIKTEERIKEEIVDDFFKRNESKPSKN